MRTLRILPTVLLGLLMQSTVAEAEDIDLYSGLGGAAGAPNVLIVLDTAANFSANATGTCSYQDGTGSPSMAGTLAGLEQCSLYNVVDSLPVNPNGSARVNIGIMIYNKTGLSAACTSVSSAGGCVVQPLLAMTTANKASLKSLIKNWQINDIKTNSESNGAIMQEAWAYYTGNTGVSGRTYAGVGPAAGCQKNFVIFIGNAYNTVGSPGEGGLGSDGADKLLDASRGIASSPISITYKQGEQCNTSSPYYAMPNHTTSSGLYADEWARYMRGADIYGDFTGQQNIITYTIGALGPSCKADYPALLKSMASAGGGKYYPVNADAADQITQAILKILNEVQAVNSVFASSSLPVSVNAQGTYLNQIFMGMFRPDPNGDPRWLGNLKQYQFVAERLADNTISLKLGDSLGQPAISSAGTGFISPNAVSFWTSKDTTVEPDLGGGFWRNTPNGVGLGYDSPDGELVEKGGAAQVLRKTLLTVDYTTTAGSSTNPRNLYTYCPSGASCASGLSNSANRMDSANVDITDAMLGTGSRTITAISSATTVSGTTASAGQSLAVTGTADSGSDRIATASAADVAKIGATGATGSLKMANGDTCTCTVASSTTFVYPKTCGVAGAQTISLLQNTLTITKAGHGLSAGQKVTLSNCSVLTGANGQVGNISNVATNTFDFTLSSALNGSDTNCRYTPNTATVTSVGHGFPSSETVTISGASPAGYNGAYAITVTGADTFTYQYSTAAPLAALSGSATATGGTTRTVLLRWIRGQDNKGDESGPGGSVNIRPSVHGDVLHSRPVVINYGSNIVAYYGANDGVFHAVSGDQTGANAGKELWGFIPPELLGKLKRLRDNNPQLLLPTTPAGIIPTPQKKDYFIDGPTGLYQVLNADGTTNKAIIYLSMRRGGRFLYALDVTNQNSPSFLWRIRNTDTNFGELGQTWSLPKIALAKGYTTNPLIFLGAGYDPVEDSEPPTTATMGRGIFVADAQTGALVWRAIPKASGSTTCSGSAPVTCEVVGMKYGIASDLTVVDRNNDGKADRLYAVDLGGNVWRVDLEPGGDTSPGDWKIYKIAALGCTTGECASGTTPRKFFYPADIVSAAATGSTDTVIVGSGDREHPLSTHQAYNVTNRIYAIKDVVGNDGSSQAVVTEAELFDATNANYDNSGSGYYITLGTGEKVVNAPTTVAGFTYFGTNQPIPPSPNSCTTSLGEAKGYRLNPFSGARTVSVFDGGGFPPTPVAGIVNVTVDGKNEQLPFLIGAGGTGDGPPGTPNPCGGSSSLEACKPTVNVSSARTRTYWYYLVD